MEVTEGIETKGERNAEAIREEEEKVEKARKTMMEG